MVHNNVDFAGIFLFSDFHYDYSMVNSKSKHHSATRYFGVNGGEYESYPLYHLSDGGMIEVPLWVYEVICEYNIITNNSDEKMVKLEKELR